METIQKVKKDKYYYYNGNCQSGTEIVKFLMKKSRFNFKNFKI